MLHTHQTELVAGLHGGKKVRCAPGARPAYQKLTRLADYEKNYWATMIVNGIKGLAAGRLHMDNVYIDKKANLAYGDGYFQVIWPGARIVVKKQANDEYLIQSILPDFNYLQKQEAMNEPGLWKVDKVIDTAPVFRPDGMIEPVGGRAVAIADMAEDDPLDVARAVHKDLVNVNGSIKLNVQASGFDLHYTPGDGGIIGLKKARDALADTRDRKITRSATLLANTMYRARDVTGVVWCSDWGGSAVLTRALEILGQEGINLKKHGLFLNRPTCKPNRVFKAAVRAGITPLDDKGGKKVGLRKEELLGHFLVVDKPGSLGWKLAKRGLAGTGIVGSAYGAASAGAFATVAGTVFTVVGVAGSMLSLRAALSTGKDMLKPKQYR